MDKVKMIYFEKEDILHLSISPELEAGSIEISPKITAEINEEGELIGIEILNATSFIKELILESTQAKILDLTKNNLSSVI
jgi:uncharacterized protein YuzE